MADIEERYFQQLLDAGLYVWFCFGGKDRVLVGKPVSTPGNSIPDYRENRVTIDPMLLPPEMDAPMILFKMIDGIFVVNSVDHAGGIVPSDFVNRWSSGQEAVADILDFYFGDRKRMKAKAETRRKAIARSEALHASQKLQE